MVDFDANSQDEAALETGRLLFAKECTFMLGCVTLEQLPAPTLPEIAFAGRSNVGKSSLINALTGRKALARTSNTPGRTREINFFEFRDRLRLVDMPGYGFAKVPKAVVEGWTQLIHDYLRGRAVLRRLCVLVDGRHGLKPNDDQLMTLLDKAAVNYRVVLTKADKPHSAEIRRIYDDVVLALKKHPAAVPEPMITSAEKGLGIAELRAELASFAEPPVSG
ncbi:MULTISPECIES: ribosome biogenesis GTP-binding protein YihA/YsxC [unclassified Hwanghaeella]|jgi:GTP-binding protein|uniref:ribosome biogenesis GTP-binding protein YihA/YsxC n=1 Tax=unclassified Hwanghaeella TaxID=2605944 RepID=UPI000C8B41FB|nr:YihA family ribosome biogenesis GTP-binding protein [Rhodospirillales bacterium]|tara:strand:- start:1182 stop:1844 length:663 start_codon:yes stop_codon:yes gene_type:complete